MRTRFNISLILGLFVLSFALSGCERNELMSPASPEIERSISKSSEDQVGDDTITDDEDDEDDKDRVENR